MAFEITKEVAIEIDNLKGSYLKNVYTVKLNEVISYINLWVFEKYFLIAVEICMKRLRMMS